MLNAVPTRAKTTDIMPVYKDKLHEITTMLEASTVFILALSCLFIFATPASAAEKSFSKMTIDVPEGWTAFENSGVVAVTAPGNAAALSIVLDKTGGASGADVAKAMSQALGGTNPVLEDDTFIFTFKKGDVKSVCVLAVEADDYVMFTLTDPTGTHGEAMSAIAASVVQK